MATPRDVRRLAFQCLFQLDARSGDEPTVRESIAELAEFTPRERDQALELARGAFARRAEADRVMVGLAPTWPAHRQAAVDRAILRLAYHEMTSGKTSPKIVVNEAVELAKAYSTEKSPAFINGLLDKVLKRVLAERAGPAEDRGAPEPAGGTAGPGAAGGGEGA
ncbi:MAG TPA: transcription antitermination factor NusB [Phycisphaerales bacterium]|nr:transcription antitermination factor NusB [Phycisphaerales bacterium]